MSVRDLTGSPSILPLYLRAAAPLAPGASRLPFIPGGGGEMPELELRLTGVKADHKRLAAYAEVCGFSLPGTLPATYPHVLAFPLHMALMADGSFPFGAVGLVHVANRITQHRPIRSSERLALRVHPTGLEPHPRGRTFSIVSEARVDGELVWEGLSTILRRGGGGSAGGGGASGGDGGSERSAGADGPEGRKGPAGGSPSGKAPAKEAEWRLPGDLGRRYGAASGDRNPIHMHALTAKPLGFPRAIAHGMWTKARCLAALESRLPKAFSVEVRFRKPILLPGSVAFASAQEAGAEEGEEIRFAVSDAQKGTPHLDGAVRPLSKEGS